MRVAIPSHSFRVDPRLLEFARCRSLVVSGHGSVLVQFDSLDSPSRSPEAPAFPAERGSAGNAAPALREWDSISGSRDPGGPRARARSCLGMSQKNVEIMRRNHRAFMDREFDAAHIDHIGARVQERGRGHDGPRPYRSLRSELPSQ
jgi:hypothetical protein